MLVICLADVVVVSDIQISIFEQLDNFGKSKRGFYADKT